MNGCIYRTRSDLCMKFTTDQSISFCVGKKCPDRKESNADRIRSMSDEKLAELLNDIAELAYSEGYSKETDEPYMSPYPPTKSAWGNWLKQEAADKGGE